MAHFYAEITGAKGVVTKTGTRETGLTAHVRGYTVGVYVEIRHNDFTKMDEVYVHLTGGTGALTAKKMIGAWNEDWDKIIGEG